MGFKEYFWDVIRNHYVDFDGVATRKQFWLFVLWNFIISAIIIVLAILFYYSTSSDFNYFYSILLSLFVIGVYNLLALLPNISIMVRRLHDAGFSGWFLLLNFVPYVGSLIVFIMLVLPSKTHNNKYNTKHNH